MLEAGVALDRPIHIVYVSTGGGRVASPRTVILAPRRSEARIVESYVGLGGGEGFTNAVTECVLEEGAILDHYRIQREARDAFHVASTRVTQARASAYRSHVVSLGGALARHDLTARLDGEGAECTLNGLYVVTGTQHMDHHTTVDHAQPHGTSHQLYKGVLDDRGRGVFDGMVIVREGAQKTDSRQENRNLILSEEALVDTKPTLRIHADDVKCSHAATTGQLDEASTFYLRSRALDPEAARRIMIHAFAGEIARGIRIDAVREGIDALLFPTGDSGDPEAS